MTGTGLTRRAFLVGAAACGLSGACSASLLPDDPDDENRPLAPRSTVRPPLGPDRRPAYGFAFEPPPGADGIDRFFEAAGDLDIIAWHGDREGLRADGGAAAVARIARDRELSAVIVTSPFDRETGALLGPFDEAERADELDRIAAFAAAEHPAWFGYGDGIDRLLAHDRAAFDLVGEHFGEVWKTIQRASPGTEMFTVAHLDGLEEVATSLLAPFGRARMIGVRAEPAPRGLTGAEVGQAAQQLKERLRQPVAFVSLGWPADPGGDSTPQSAFVEQLPDVVRLADPEFIVWDHLFDLGGSGDGLIDADGVPRPALATWRRLSAR